MGIKNSLHVSIVAYNFVLATLFDIVWVLKTSEKYSKNKRLKNDLKLKAHDVFIMLTYML